MLFFSQCCGYDLVNRYAGKLQPLATPHYGAEGCEGSKYANRCTMHTATGCAAAATRPVGHTRKQRCCEPSTSTLRTDAFASRHSMRL